MVSRVVNTYAEHSSTVMTQDVTFDTGTALGERYELREEIGEGSFGRIYRARQLDVDRDVAIKILPPQFCAMDNVVERFRREARLASRLHHPNTITIYEYGRHEQVFFIAMEYLRGEDLADRLARERTIELSAALHIARQTLSSLKEAHQLGIIHRDLKPENIFLTHMGDDDTFVKILDFGIAKLASHHPQTTSEDGRALTIQGSTVGTPIYMSPEQAAGEEVDSASDLYALGIILYEMVNGSPPFERERPVRTMRAHLFDPVPDFPNQDLQGTVFESIVRRALAKEPADRFDDAEDFLQALSRSDLQEPVPNDGEGAKNDTVPFESVSDRIPADQAPPPAGFSAQQGSVTSSIITVLDAPEDEDVIVLTKKKTRGAPGQTPSAQGDFHSDGPSSLNSTAPNEVDSSPPQTPDHSGDWGWSEDIAATDASGSQILTGIESEGTRRWVIALAALLVVAAAVTLALIL